MGQKIVKYYDFVNKEGGGLFRTRLAVATGIPSTKAAAAADSPENIAKFKKAIQEITGKTVD